MIRKLWNFKAKYMRKNLFLLKLTLILSLNVYSQLIPQEAILQMSRGINLGNSFDATPTETSWGNPLIQKYYFDDIVNAGFTCVRIPVTWKFHTSKSSSYTINQTWLNRVDSVVTWGLNKGLYVIINAHHEDGLKATDGMTDPIAKADTLAKYDSIWTQVSRHFKDKSDHLLFEILNEPHTMTQSSVDLFNARILSIIRKTNPTRIVVYSGTSYTGSDQLIAAKIPDPNDKYLIGYYHSYDPWNFAGLAIGTYGSAGDISSTIAKFTQVSNWSTLHNIPVLLGECGTVKKCDYNSRMIYYATLVEQALNRKIAFAVWDDNGDFQTYIRSTRKWNDVKDVIIHTYKESPTQLKAVVIDTTLTLSWLNRTTLNDSIILDRRTVNTEFAPIAKLDSSASQFYDSGLHKNTTYYYRLCTRLQDSIDLYSYPIEVNIIGVRKPYLGSINEIPGTIEAENYDIGGDGQTYHDNNSINKGGAYRLTEGVDVESRPENGYQIGFVANGEWTQYSAHVDLPGLYRIDTYTASVNGGGKYSFSIGKTSISNISVPKTGDSTTLSVSSVYRVSLDTGNQIVTFKIVSGSSNPFTIDKFVFIQDSSTATAINDQKMTNLFTIFPNPAVSDIIVTKPESISFVRLDIYNILGKKIKTEILTKNETVLSVDGMEKGIYVFVFTNTNYSETKRVIVE
jgi:aryl-phospho-beta-D-glucosidase BglC (GH1 family)